MQGRDGKATMTQSRSVRSCHGNELKPEAAGGDCGRKKYNANSASMSVVGAHQDSVDELELSETGSADDRLPEILKEIKGRLTLSGQCGAGLPDAVESGRDTFRRRVSAYPAGYADRLRSGGSPVYPGRAQHRTSPAGQREAAQDAERICRDLGNTLIVVEHDEETMFAADHIVDIGPAAGIHGGKLVCAGHGGRYYEMPGFPHGAIT